MAYWKTRLFVECEGGMAPAELSLTLDDAERDPRESRVDTLRWLLNDALDGLDETLTEHPDTFKYRPSGLVLFIEPQPNFEVQE